MSSRIAVIGGGSAGVMAALRVVLNNNKCLLFPGSAQNKKSSRAMWVRKIENMPAHFHYKRGIEEPNAEVLKWIAESEFKNNLRNLENTGISKIKKLANGNFELEDSFG